MWRMLTGATITLGLLAGACSGDDAPDTSAVTSIPDDTTTSSTTTTEPDTVAPDVIPADESLITEEYVQGVLDGLAQASLDAVLATKAAGVTDARAIEIANATGTTPQALRDINELTELARNDFAAYRPQPGPVSFTIEELKVARADCILAAVDLDLSKLFADPPEPPPGQPVIELLPATDEQRSTGLNPTAWVIDSLPIITSGDEQPDCEVSG